MAVSLEVRDRVNISSSSIASSLSAITVTVWLISPLLKVSRVVGSAVKSLPPTVCMAGRERENGVWVWQGGRERMVCEWQGGRQRITCCVPSHYTQSTPLT